MTAQYHSTNLPAAFVDLFPHLSGFLGDFCDRDSRILGLDPLSVRIQPQHVGAHGSLRGSCILHLLLLVKETAYITFGMFECY